MKNMSAARFVGVLQDLQGCCRRNTRIAFAIIALFAYRKIDDADLCSAVVAVLIHALGGMAQVAQFRKRNPLGATLELGRVADRSEI